MRIASIKKAFANAVEQADLKDVHPHDLRRTCGSWLVQAGVPIQTVSKLLRHSDIRVTDQVYAHLAPTTVRAAVEVLNVNTVSRSGFTLTEIAAKEVENRLQPVDL
jgi:integrase